MDGGVGKNHSAAAAPLRRTAKVSGLVYRLERAIQRNIRRRLIEDDVQIVFELAALLPLAADEGRRAGVRHWIGRTALPGDRTDQ